MKLLVICLSNLLLVPALAALEYQQQLLDIEGTSRQVTVPKGYRLETLTTSLDKPRMLTFADRGELFIGSRSGSVYRLSAPYTQPEVLIQLPDYPHSVARRPGEILIAQTNGLYRAAYRPGQADIPSSALKLLAALPSGGGHSSRTVRVGPDGRVYVSLGISGNCSDQFLDATYPFPDRRGGILVLHETDDKTTFEHFASGLRNPVGFDWQPHSGIMYASNNGPDHHGFEQPPEYFSRLDPGSFHGMPWFQYDGRQLRRDSCIRRAPPKPAAEVAIPVATFPARNAPMAVAFVPGNAMDTRFHGDAIVALRGSWATRPSGSASGDRATRRPPKLVRVRFISGRAQGVDDLIRGFQLGDGERWARPVGVAFGPDGALYFTSDSGVNALFRLRPEPKVANH